MDYRRDALDQLIELRPNIKGKRVFAGLDGFVDTIIQLVAQRNGQGEDFVRIDTIKEFGERIIAASGKSTNIEMYPQMEKLGGNGPIYANALISAGFPMRYLGSLGSPAIHPIFAGFAGKSNAVSIATPGLTNAIEFHDGKIMMGITKTLEDISYPAIINALGSEEELQKELQSSTLVGLVNWTMIPNMTAIFRNLLDNVLPKLDGSRTFFFDLADPEKRSDAELEEALATISEFEKFGPTIIGLNLKEAQRVSSTLKLGSSNEEAESLKNACSEIREKLTISTVVIHPKERAACATSDGSWCVEGPYVENPKVTTGAGDHFNAGFTTGHQLGFSPEACLTIGTCFSGFYVRSAESPSLDNIQEFLENWK